MVKMERIKGFGAFFLSPLLKYIKSRSWQLPGFGFGQLSQALGGVVAQLGFGSVHSMSGTSSCQCQTKSVL